MAGDVLFAGVIDHDLALVLVAYRRHHPELTRTSLIARALFIHSGVWLDRRAMLASLA